MNRKLLLFAVSLYFLLILTSCGNQSGGPQSWIDQPLEADNPFELAPLTLQAHASDLDGVSKIFFSVDETIYATINRSGNIIEDASYEWTPPGPGKYLVSIWAEDEGNNQGVPAQIEVIILGEKLAAIESPVQTEEVQAPEEPAPEVVETEDVEQIIETEEVEPEEDSPEIVSPVAIAVEDADCRLGPGTIYETVHTILTGYELPIVGKSEDQKWWVVETYTIDPCWVEEKSVKVEGNIYEIIVVDPPSVPIVDDTIPPIISSASANPDPIFLEGCAGSVKITRLTVETTDNFGVMSVGGTYKFGSQTVDFKLDHMGGSTYQKDFGPFQSAGIVEFFGSSEDFLGNWTWYETQVTVKNCLE